MAPGFTECRSSCKERAREILTVLHCERAFQRDLFASNPSSTLRETTPREGKNAIVVSSHGSSVNQSGIEI